VQAGRITNSAEKVEAATLCESTAAAAWPPRKGAGPTYATATDLREGPLLPTALADLDILDHFRVSAA